MNSTADDQQPPSHPPPPPPPPPLPTAQPAASGEPIICADSIRKRRIRPQNIVCRLALRERGGAGRPGTQIHALRQFYTNIVPNLSVTNVEKPPGFLRKFSPDGKLLIGFTFDQTAVEIYRFRGVAAAAHLTNGWPAETVSGANGSQSYGIRSRIFASLFRLQHVVHVTTMGKQLNRECSLFTADGRYVIVGAASFIADESRPHFYELYTSNEAVGPTLRSPLEDFSLYLIDLHTGRVSDQINFRVDKIYLAHNQGLYLYNTTFAILSVQHQIVHIYKLHEGHFYSVYRIGRFCTDLEHCMYHAVYATVRPYREATINSLKHRFLAFLFRRAQRLAEETGDKYELRKFYQLFDEYRALRMWKMQLLDDNHLLLRYATEDVVVLKATEPNTQPSYFVVYNIWDSQVLAVYDNCSEELLELFERHMDEFRNTRRHSPVQLPCSPATSIYAQLLQQRFKTTIVSARGGGMQEATRRILSQLPISAQSYSNSPYLDLGLFSYDDKWVSGMERPKACSDGPIRFFARDSGMLKFRIYPGLRQAPTAERRLVAFTFHPTEPFVISVQRVDNDYVVNFHLWNPRTEEEQSPGQVG